MKNDDNFIELIRAVSADANRIFVTGVSGSGKSYLSHMAVVDGSLDCALLSLDDYGSEIDGDWIVDIDALIDDTKRYPELLLIEGTCDNFIETVETIGGIVVFVIPGERIFRASNLRKYVDMVSQNTTPKAWLAHWRKMIGGRDHDINKLVYGRLKLLRKRLSKEIPFFTYLHDPTVSPSLDISVYDKKVSPEIKALILSAGEDFSRSLSAQLSKPEEKVIEGWHVKK